MKLELSFIIYNRYLRSSITSTEKISHLKDSRYPFHVSQTPRKKLTTSIYT